MTSSTPPILDAGLPGGRELPVNTVLRGSEARKAIRSAFSSPVASFVVLVLTVLWTIPTLGFFLNSLRSKSAVYGSGWWTWFAHPSFDLSNYNAVLFSNGGEVLPLVNSLAITIPATIIPIFIASMAAYALAWVRFRGSDFIFFGLFALQVVPLQMALVPLQRFYSTGAHIGTFTIFPGLHLEGSLAEIWISHTMFSLPLAVFLLHNFIAALPSSLIEAARVDGASYLRIYRSIVLPLTKPAIASFAIFQFLWVWNDLLVALTFAGGTPQVAPLTVRLAQLSGSFGSHWEALTAGAFVSILLPLIVFFSLQRYFVRGLLAGSVKG